MYWQIVRSVECRYFLNRSTTAIRLQKIHIMRSAFDFFKPTCPLIETVTTVCQYHEVDVTFHFEPCYWLGQIGLNMQVTWSINALPDLIFAAGIQVSSVGQVGQSATLRQTYPGVHRTSSHWISTGGDDSGAVTNSDEFLNTCKLDRIECLWSCNKQWRVLKCKQIGPEWLFVEL